MKRKLLSLLAGFMIITIFAMSIDNIQYAFVKEEHVVRESAKTSGFKSISSDTKHKPINFSVPVMVPCTDTKLAEKEMLEQGLKILATGLVSLEEVVEVWVHPKNKSFAVVKIHPNLGVTCLLTGGPVFVPGGEYLDSSDTPRKRTPL